MKDTMRKTNLALEEDVWLMEVGEVGPFGQVVEVIVQYQDTGNVITQLQQMGDLNVRVKIRKTNIVLKDNVGKVLILCSIHLSLYCIISAIIISGGYTTSSASRSVEILRANGSYWCSLPDLPDDRYGRFGHTQSGLVTCGGWDRDTPTSCLTFSSGLWKTYHQLQHSRYWHSSWMSQHGVVLMGGGYSPTTTEILTEDGQYSSSFKLKYRTQYL